MLMRLCLTICAGGRHFLPLQVDRSGGIFELESGVRVTCDVNYLCANFILPSEYFSCGSSDFHKMCCVDAYFKNRNATRMAD